MLYSFGDFELDEPRFELRRAGQPVAIQPKALKLLLFLVAQRHRAVADDELMAELWPHETVSRASIKRAVMGARTALDNRSQDCIRTVRGRGYQFVMAGCRVSNAEAPYATDSPGTTDSPNAIDSPATREVGAEPASPAALASAARPSPAATDFVGRRAVLAELDLGLSDARAGRGRCLLLLGEPGIGKTRTLQTFAEQASQHAHVWLGRCMEIDGAPPFWPLLQILRQALHDCDRSQLRALLGPGASDIAEALPELSHWLPDLPASPAIGSGPGRFRFFDSLTTFIERIAAGRPVVLLFDDLQRADQPTLHFLLFLASKLDTTRVLVVGTCRPTSHRDAGVAALLAELSRASATRTVEIGGWSMGELGSYVALRTGAPAAESMVAELHGQTAGNPLFVEEVVRCMRTAGADPAATTTTTATTAAAATLAVRTAGAATPDVRALATGHGLRGAIERHLEMLPDDCQRLLAAASVLGRDVSGGLLTQITERARAEVQGCLAEGVATGVLHVVDAGVGQYRFTHALIRDVLYERMTAPERAAAHARAGLILEAHDAVLDDARLSAVAEHFMLAAPDHDGGRALRYARLAAERAADRLAYEEAAGHYGRALQVLELGPPDPAQHMALLLARGEALALGATPADARKALLQAASLAHELGAKEVIIKAATLLAQPRESGNFDAVRTNLLREAMAGLPEGDPRTPWLQGLLAKSLSYSEHHVERAKLALSALELSASVTEPVLRAEALHACLQALTQPDYLKQRLYIAEALRQLAHQLADARFMLYATTARFQNSVECGDVVGMDDAIETLDQLAQQVRDPVVRWYATTFRSTRALIDGNADLAEQHAERALHMGKVVGEELAYHDYCIQANGILRMRGRLEEAEAMAREMSLRFPALPGWRATVAAIGADLGKAQLARQVLAELIEPGLALLRTDPCPLGCFCAVAELCARVGDPTQASILHDALLPYVDHQGIVSFGGGTFGPVSLTLAQLARRMRDNELAEAHCQRALAESERMGSPLFSLMSYFAHLSVLRRVNRDGARTQARQIIAQARPLAQRIGLEAMDSGLAAWAQFFGAAEGS